MFTIWPATTAGPCIYFVSRTMHYYLDFPDRQTMKAIFEALIQSQKLEIWVSWDFASSITTTATFKYCEKVGTEIRVYGWLLCWLARCQKFCSFALHFSVCITFEKCCHIVHWFEISVFNPNLDMELATQFWKKSIIYL